MRVVLIGCLEFSDSAFRHILANRLADVVGVVTRSQSQFNADFKSLHPRAREAGIPTLIVEGADQDKLAKWLSELKPDFIFCFGWSFLLRDEILKIPKSGAIGFHPAQLPQNRGRHPIVWALALGLSKTASTFFFMDGGADSGDILSQVPVSISAEDNAASLYQKITTTALEQISEFAPKLANRTFERRPQDHSRATSWRKRGAADGQIDWRMSADAIHNLVRALTRPYIGAHCRFDGEDVKIWKTELQNAALETIENLEPGKVLAVDRNGTFTVKCGSGCLRVLQHEFKRLPEAGSYL